MIFLTSDTHFGHEKVAKLRGFDTVAEHDIYLGVAWMATVAEDDTVWHLGDVAMGGWRNSLPLLRELPGKKHLVLGNHDRAHPLNSNGYKYTDEYLTVFDSVQTAAAIRFMGETWLLSHLPYDGDHTEDERFTQWRLRDEGTPLFHGHTHGPETVNYSQAGTLQVHVGVDSKWGMGPVPLTDIKLELERTKENA